MESTPLESMQRLLNEMENNLCADITLTEWAYQFGYSPWHFARLFHKTVGMPLMQYRTRRRLMHALYAISQGKSIIDAALRYGFDTHAGFFKAFQQAYGCSPSEYIRRYRVIAPVPLILKEERYPMISNTLWAQALAHWGMDLPLSPIIFPGSGRIHDACKKAGDKYLLKAYTDYTACKMQVDLALALDEKGLPAALPIQDTQGEYIFECQSLYFVFSRAIPGEPLQAKQLIKADPHVSGHAIGSALHHLHLALDQLDPCPVADHQDLLSTLKNWALPRVRKHLIIDDEWLQRYEEAITALFPQLPRGPIHRDPNPSNLIGTPNGHIGFIDFDLAENNIRLYDPCYAATAVLSECFDEKEHWLPFFRGLLKGYDTAHPLSHREWQAAPLIALGIEMICIAAFENVQKYQDIFDTNVRMLKWLAEQPDLQLP